MAFLQMQSDMERDKYIFDNSLKQVCSLLFVSLRAGECISRELNQLINNSMKELELIGFQLRQLYSLATV